MKMDEIRQFIIDLYDELERDIEKHELGQQVANRQPWVLWNDRTELEDKGRNPIIDELINLFNKLRNL